MRVLLIDDHALFRAGLQGLLERRGIEVVASVADGEAGVRAAAEHSPDVVLLDLRMPHTDGLEVLRRMRRNGLAMPIVMLTTSSSEQDLLQALRSGAQGYLIKDMDPDELVAALAEITSGNVVVAPDLTHVLVRAVQGEPEPPPEQDDHSERGALAELTPREQEILCHLAEGQSNKVIARRLGISDGTVKLHVKAILRKLRVHSRVEAAVMAVEEGFCDRS